MNASRWHIYRALHAVVPILIAVLATSVAGFIFDDPGRSQDGEAYCASRVISDWSDDGAVNGNYRLSCYRAAIRRLPDDLRSYSDAPEAIARAMQQAAI